MKSRKDDFLLGLATIAIVGILVSTIIFLVPIMKSSGQSITIHFDHKDGLAPLAPGSQVMLSGAMSVGEVKSVKPRPDKRRMPSGEFEDVTIFEVVATIDPTKVTLFGDCEITTDQPAVGGNGSVVIVNVGTFGTPLKMPIIGRPPQSLSAAIAAVSRRFLAPGGMVDRLDQMLDPSVENSILHKLLTSLEDVNHITSEIRTQLSPKERDAFLAKIHTLLDDLNATTAAIRRETSAQESASTLAKVSTAIDRLNEALGEASEILKENRPAIRETISSVKSIARQTDEELIAAVKRELDRDDPKSLFGQLHASLDAALQTMGNLREISDEARELVVLSRPLITRSIENFKTTSDQLRLASQEIRLAPWRLLFQPTPEEKAKMGVFESARTFAEAATYLDDAVARLQAVIDAKREGEELSLSADELRGINDSLRAAFQRFEKAESYLYEKLK